MILKTVTLALLAKWMTDILTCYGSSMRHLADEDCRVLTAACLSPSSPHPGIEAHTHQIISGWKWAPRTTKEFSMMLSIQTTRPKNLIRLGSSFSLAAGPV